MRALKIFFLSRLLREKLMMVVLVAIAVLWWGSVYSKRAAIAWRNHHSLTSRLALQKQWLANRASIEAAAQEAIKNLDPARTYDDTRLVGELSAMAREFNLKLTNDAPQTAGSGQFAVHTVQINLRQVEWDTLTRFYYSLADRSPYLGVTQFAVSATPNPALLNASLQVTSVEVVHQ